MIDRLLCLNQDVLTQHHIMCPLSRQEHQLTSGNWAAGNMKSAPTPSPFRTDLPSISHFHSRQKSLFILFTGSQIPSWFLLLSLYSPSLFLSSPITHAPLLEFTLFSCSLARRCHPEVSDGGPLDSDVCRQSVTITIKSADY